MRHRHNRDYPLCGIAHNPDYPLCGTGIAHNHDYPLCGIAHNREYPLCGIAKNHVLALCGIVKHENDIVLKKFHPKPYGLNKQSNNKSFISENAKLPT
jgi:hypothetical protein